jgi:hypothetical protein
LFGGDSCRESAGAHDGEDRILDRVIDAYFTKSGQRFR